MPTVVRLCLSQTRYVWPCSSVWLHVRIYRCLSLSVSDPLYLAPCPLVQWSVFVCLRPILSVLVHVSVSLSACTALFQSSSPHTAVYVFISIYSCYLYSAPHTAVLSWYPYTAAVCIYLCIQLLPVFISMYSCYLYLAPHRAVIFIFIYSCCLLVHLYTDAVYHYLHDQLSSVFSSIYKCLLSLFLDTAAFYIYLHGLLLFVFISKWKCYLS